ncbi:hypothetical protein OPAG_08141 [Rhodococcus opacus PD630]|uniref:hypothetical protein n=1 Tax=Rhodococcus opacus TaxID=37919 RepID=UPI00029CBF49|nr:hypothetical protein [Rhodococcus opacus]AHK35342.1 hypothetical protein Pd630_LPD09102 [Rhodococcus opacus PD630]EHI41323.1 hypothetical protein OPAG_08141 [Rhodococcus opacus PD630]UDH01641.1 hypothetical protein K2Z90_008066 [Rhodococcus opacus PD630]
MTLHAANPTTDDERDAWQLHQRGMSWAQVGREIGCTEAAARAFAAAYQQRTDAAADEAQISLF